MSNELNQEADHAEFEAAYQKEFPVSASLLMDKFDRDEHGDYKENCVYTAYHLWQAARRASAPSPAEGFEEANLPALPKPTTRIPLKDASGWTHFTDAYTAEQVQACALQIRREAIMAARAYQRKVDEKVIGNLRDKLTAASRDAARYNFIEQHATLHGGGNGFTITCFVGADEEDMGVGIDKMIAAAPSPEQAPILPTEQIAAGGQHCTYKNRVCFRMCGKHCKSQMEAEFVAVHKFATDTDKKP